MENKKRKGIIWKNLFSLCSRQKTGSKEDFG